MQPTRRDRQPLEPPPGLSRRALLRGGAFILGTAAFGSVLEACTSTPAAPTAVSKIPATKLVLLDAANIDAPDMAPRKQVVTEFMARNPDVTMDFRALPSNIQWDRVARTTILSGEPVDLVNINGQF